MTVALLSDRRAAVILRPKSARTILRAIYQQLEKSEQMVNNTAVC